MVSPTIFFRYTPFYFTDRARKFNFEVLDCGTTGDPISFPLLVLCQSIRVIFKRLRLLELSIILLMNLTIFVLKSSWDLLGLKRRFWFRGICFLLLVCDTTLMCGFVGFFCTDANDFQPLVEKFRLVKPLHHRGP